MVSWNNSKGFGGNNSKTPMLSEQIHMPKLPENETVVYRFIGPLHAVAEMWFEVFTKTGKTARIRKLATNYNSETGDFEGECPYQELLGLKPRPLVYTNAINRDTQDNEPKKRGKMTEAEKKLVEVGVGADVMKAHIKVKGSEVWSPVQAIRLPSTAANRVIDSSATNKHKDKKTGENKRFGPNHPVYGYDISIKYNPKASPADQYFIQKEKLSKLTDEEREYCLQNIWLDKPEDKKTAQSEAEKFLKMGLVERDDEGNITNSPPGKDGGKGGKAKEKKKADYLGGLGDDDDTDLEKSKKDKKKKDKSGKGGKAKDLDVGKSKKDKGGDKGGKADKGKDKKKDKGKKSKFDL